MTMVLLVYAIFFLMLGGMSIISHRHYRQICREAGINITSIEDNADDKLAKKSRLARS